MSEEDGNRAPAAFVALLVRGTVTWVLMRECPSASVDYPSQAAAWAASTVPAEDFRPGLTDSRAPRLPGGANGGRFPLREPPSPQRTPQAIGRMPAGPEYTTGSHARIRDNVHGWLPDTSDDGRRPLAWELREYRERCRL